MSLYRILFVACTLLLAGCQSGPAARSSPDSIGSLALNYREADASSDDRFAALVVDAGTGKILYARNAEDLRYPASITKLMTLYILFEELDRGSLTLDSELSVSAFAASQSPSKLGLRAGSTIRVRDAMLALAVKSANDVAVVVAENIAGSEIAFASRMTRTAQGLGMRSTAYRNASGLPDPDQVTTATDIAILANALQKRFPDRYPLFSTRSFTFAGKTHRSTNRLLGEVEGMDGMKTGYTNAAGFNLATSVRRHGRRINVVVLGAESGAARSERATALIETYLPERRGWLAMR